MRLAIRLALWNVTGHSHSLHKTTGELACSSLREVIGHVDQGGAARAFVPGPRPRVFVGVWITPDRDIERLAAAVHDCRLAMGVC